MQVTDVLHMKHFEDYVLSEILSTTKNFQQFTSANVTAINELAENAIHF